MNGEKAGQARQSFVSFGVVLHRARTKRIEVGVDAHVLGRQVDVMANDIDLRQFGKRERLGGSEFVRQRIDGRERNIAGGKEGRATPWSAEIKKQLC